MNACERRKAIRFESEIPVRIKQGMGTTRNFSTDGVYFVTNQPLSVGESIQFAIPIEYSGLGRSFHIRCQGEVLRVEPSGEKGGVAVAINSYSFEKVQNSSES